MNLEELRAEIDTIDDNLLQDFAQRMNVVGQIGLEKKSEGLPTLDPAREREKLADIVTKLPPEMEQYGYTLWSMLFEISRSYQSSLNPQPSALRKDIERAIADTQPLFPPRPPWLVRAWRALTPSWPATGCSACPTSSTSPPSTRCSPPLKRACASMS